MIRKKNTSMRGFTKKLLALLLLTSAGMSDSAESPTDSLPDGRQQSQFSVALSSGWGYLAPKGDHNKAVMKTHDVGYLDFRLQWKSNRNDAYDRAFHHPTIEAGLLLGDFTHVHLQGPETPYEGKVGREAALYGGFRWDFWQCSNWSAGMNLQNGVAYFTEHFDEHTNADNWLVGSPLSVFISAGAYMQYQFSPRWKASLGIDFKHVSNGTMSRPNLGANTFGPMLMVAMTEPSRGKESDTPSNRSPQAADASTFPYKEGHGLYGNSPWGGSSPLCLELSAGIAGSTLRDQFTAYHSNHHPLYGSFIAMAAPMYRYHPIMASGLEMNYVYATYADHIGYYDKLNGYGGHDYSRHVFGAGFRHEFFYRHVSLHMGVGMYLYRHMGHTAATADGGSYQTVGVRYSFPSTNDRLFIGYNVKAHNFSKADCLQFSIGYRIPCF